MPASCVLTILSSACSATITDERERLCRCACVYPTKGANVKAVKWRLGAFFAKPFAHVLAALARCNEHCPGFRLAKRAAGLQQLRSGKSRWSEWPQVEGAGRQQESPDSPVQASWCGLAGASSIVADSAASCGKTGKRATGAWKLPVPWVVVLSQHAWFSLVVASSSMARMLSTWLSPYHQPSTAAAADCHLGFIYNISSDAQGGSRGCGGLAAHQQFQAFHVTPAFCSGRGQRPLPLFGRWSLQQ